MTERLFFAISLPDDVKRALAELGQPESTARWTNPTHRHLTLKFLGNVTPERKEQVLAEARKIRVDPFEMRISGIGSFGRRVLWAGIDAPPSLLVLQKRIEEAAALAGFEPEDRPFHPHITLARLKGPSSNWLKPYLARHRHFSTRSFPVRSVDLFRSTLGREGAVHDVIETLPLDR